MTNKNIDIEIKNITDKTKKRIKNIKFYLAEEFRNVDILNQNKENKDYKQITKHLQNINELKEKLRNQKEILSLFEDKD